LYQQNKQQKIMNIKFDSDFEMTINGKSVNTPGQITVINPANEEIVGHAPDCTIDLLNEAVTASTRAFGHWRNVPFNSRQVLLGKMADALEANIAPLSAILTWMTRFNAIKTSGIPPAKEISGLT
jgi:acyl-CoA reductase-like NAD-dependent aldehyde dehydrogenase